MNQQLLLSCRWVFIDRTLTESLDDRWEMRSGLDHRESCRHDELDEERHYARAHNAVHLRVRQNLVSVNTWVLRRI